MLMNTKEQKLLSNYALNKETYSKYINHIVKYEGRGLFVQHATLMPAIQFHSFAIAYEIYDAKEKRWTRRFLACETILNFYISIFLNCAPNRRFFHEVLRDKRRVYFDIDSKENMNLTNDCLIALMKSVKQEITRLTGKEVVNSKDFIILESHNDVKKSYHLIMPHFVCNNHLQISEFAKKCCSSLDKQFQDMIDLSIYKKVQLFRMPLCSKATDEFRIFKFVNENFDISYQYEGLHGMTRPTSWDDDRWTKFYTKELWMRSLVNCEDSENQTVLHYDHISVEKQKEPCVELEEIPKKYKIDISKYLPSGVEVEQIVDYPDNRLFIHCVNVSGYYCEHCKRNHDKENPYFFYNKNSNILKFNCRRRTEIPDFIDI